MKAILLFCFLFFISDFAFGQFRHEKNASGDPLTEIIDPNGMKQGNWNYTDSGNHNFRTEKFSDNVLTSNLYKSLGTSFEVISFKQANISSYSQKDIKDLAASLSAIGNGEIIILEDNTIFIHFYFDKIKNKAAIGNVKTDSLKKHNLQKTIIFF